MPIWSADSKRLIFTIGGDTGTLFEQAIDGSSEVRTLLEKSRQHRIPTSVSPDGRFVLFTAENVTPARGDIWALSLTGSGEAFPLISGDFDQEQGRFSPDGRWVAYASNESGRYEISVRRFLAPLASRPAVLAKAISTTGFPRRVEPRHAGAPTAGSSIFDRSRRPGHGRCRAARRAVRGG